MSSDFLQHLGVSCPRLSTNLALSCHCLSCCVSKLRQVYKPLGQLIADVSSSTSSVHLLPVSLLPARQHSSVTSHVSAAIAHTSGSSTDVSSSIVRFRRSHNQLTPQEHNKGKKFCKRWDAGTVHLNACREASQSRRILHCFPKYFMFLLLSSSVCSSSSGLFSSNTATFIRNFRDFAYVSPRSASLLLFFSFLCSPSIVYRFSVSRLHFPQLFDDTSSE